MADEQFCRRAVEETLGQWGEIYCLINSASAFTSKGLDANSADSGRVLEVGPIAYAVMAQCAAEPMKQQGGEATVNVLSISAFIAQPHRWTYNAAKGAVHTLTNCMALDLAPYGIRVNSIGPIWIWTRENDRAAGGDRTRWEPIWGQFHMLGTESLWNAPPLFSAY